VHALEWVNTARDLPWQNAVVFRKPSGLTKGATVD